MIVKVKYVHLQAIKHVLSQPLLIDVTLETPPKSYLPSRGSHNPGLIYSSYDNLWYIIFSKTPLPFVNFRAAFIACSRLARAAKRALKGELV